MSVSGRLWVCVWGCVCVCVCVCLCVCVCVCVCVWEVNTPLHPSSKLKQPQAIRNAEHSDDCALRNTYTRAGHNHTHTHTHTHTHRHHTNIHAQTDKYSVISLSGLRDWSACSAENNS